MILILSHHTNKTIEAWFKVDNKNVSSHKQTIYEQGGTVRGLNIYIFGERYMLVDGMSQRADGILEPGCQPTQSKAIPGTTLL